MNIKKKPVKFIMIGGVLFIGLILFKSAYHKKGGEIKEVQTVAVVRGGITSTVAGAGKIACLDFYQVNSEIILPLSNPEKGEDIICTLANPEERELFQSARQKLQLAALELEAIQRRLKETERRYNRNLKNASLNLKTAMEQYKKNKKLYDAGAIPKQQLIEVENSLKRAKLQDEEAREKADIYNDAVQLKKVQIQFENSQQEMKSLLDKLNEKGIPLATGRLNRVVEVKIDEFDIKRIKVGQKVKIKGSSLPQDLSGYILKIGTEVVHEQGQPYIRVISSIENTSGIELKPGLQVEIAIEVAQVKDVMVIPLAAVLEKEGERGVYVIKTGRAVLKTVETGLCGQEMVEVKKGLKSGDIVITLGNLELKDGDRVRVRK